jgi:hypothetical protein
MDINTGAVRNLDAPGGYEKNAWSQGSPEYNQLADPIRKVELKHL